jgi:formylglycine-generating enzyme required for sulfatase activity
VINVNYKDAKAYTEWLSQKTGHAYRLPSEAEWEYAARAGTTTPFHFGETINTDQANYNGNYAYSGGPKGVYRRQTVAVGSYRGNALGLHDVHGNVWEWVEDCWNNNYADAPSDTNVWKAGDCRHRVMRGGSWNNSPWHVRSAFRIWHGTWERDSMFGFRVARTLP